MRQETVPTYRIVRPLRAAKAVKHVADADLDFELEPDGELPLDALLGRPGLSVYALDPEHGGVTFVEIDPAANLLSAPFLYQAQREHATRVVRVPYETYHALAAQVDAPAGPPVIVHSVGRCGSTLVSSMLREVPGIASLSEPDVFTAIESHVADGTLADDDAVALLRSSCRLASLGLAPTRSRPVIKPRSEVVWIAHLLDRAVPDAVTIFIYRDARRVIESYLRVREGDPGWSARFAHVPVLDAVVAGRHARRVARRGARTERFAYVLEGCTPLDIEQRGRWGKFLIQWLAKVHHYLELRGTRAGVAALRYEDLVEDPERVMRAVFAHADLPPHALPGTLAAMGRDSQEGTSFAQGVGAKWRLSSRDERELARTFREYTPLDGPDAILPGTLGRG